MAIAVLGIDQVFLVGHDWGAYVAWHFCLFRPDRIRALVNFSVAFNPRNPSKKPIPTLRAAFGDDYYMCRFQVMMAIGSACKDDKYGMDNGKYVRYTPEQVEALERLYHDCPKPSSLRHQQLIRECPILSNIEPKQIKVWFQNRRKLSAMNKLLMEENDRLQKQVSQLVYESTYFRQQTQNANLATTDTSCESMVTSGQHHLTPQHPPRDASPAGLLSIAEETLAEFLSKATIVAVEWVQMPEMKVEQSAALVVIMSRAHNLAAVPIPQCQLKIHQVMYFNQILTAVLEVSDDSDSSIRELALLLIVEMLKNQKDCMEDSMEIVIEKLLHVTKDTVAKFANEAEHCLTILLSQYDPFRCLSVIVPLLVSEDEKTLVTCIDCLTKKVSCLRLLKSFSPKNFEPKTPGHIDDDPDMDQIVKLGRRGQVTDQLMELPNEQQIYDMVDAEGSKGLTITELTLISLMTVKQEKLNSKETS